MCVSVSLFKSSVEINYLCTCGLVIFFAFKLRILFSIDNLLSQIKLRRQLIVYHYIDWPRKYFRIVCVSVSGSKYIYRWNLQFLSIIALHKQDSI